MKQDKILIYSVLPRLFGNDNVSRIPNGNIQVNGCGKMEDFNDVALNAIRDMGFTHIWFIGLIEHATQTDYSSWGIRIDPRCVVKGQAGSPYAIKDYYDICPDLACNIETRIDEFQALLKRCHSADLKVMIDFVPNHVSRVYHSDCHIENIVDFGATDDKDKAFDPQNNFYYLPKQRLTLPECEDGYSEYPAKATGNDQFTANPTKNDWYETIKLNYGKDYLGQNTSYNPIPNTWKKMYEILDYWLSLGVDGFRCDMAEMIPTEFWRWVLPKIKEKYKSRKPIFLAEIYQHNLYQDFIDAGFDFLYDKVHVYDSLRNIIEGVCGAVHYGYAREENGYNQSRMCYFLENHDEQRIASEFFAKSAYKAFPALPLCLLSGNNPYLHYFGQELGESGMDSEGFSGRDGRTSIFDYWSIGKIIQWRSVGYDWRKLPSTEKSVFSTYRDILQLSLKNIFINGAYYAIPPEFLHSNNCDDNQIFGFYRYTSDEICIVAVSFAPSTETISIDIDRRQMKKLNISNHQCFLLKNILTNDREPQLVAPTLFAPLELKVDNRGWAIYDLLLVNQLESKTDSCD